MRAHNRRRRRRENLLKLRGQRGIALRCKRPFIPLHHEGIASDLEGVALLSDRELLLVTDNDFGVEGAETRFYRLSFEAPL